MSNRRIWLFQRHYVIICLLPKNQVSLFMEKLSISSILIGHRFLINCEAALPDLLTRSSNIFPVCGLSAVTTSSYLDHRT